MARRQECDSPPFPNFYFLIFTLKLARDPRFDVEAADRAGLRSIGVTCGGTDANILRAAGATAVYENPADILAHCSDVAYRASK